MLSLSQTLLAMRVPSPLSLPRPWAQLQPLWQSSANHARGGVI